MAANVTRFAGVKAVLEVLGQRIRHGARGFVESHAVLREVRRGLVSIPLEVSMHDRHAPERTSPVGRYVEIRAAK